MRSHRLQLIGALLVLGRPAPGQADTCGPVQGLAYVLPVDGSPEVSRGARVVVRFALADAPIDAPALEVSVGGAALTGGVSWDGIEATFTPEQALPADATVDASVARVGDAPHRWSFRTTAGPVMPVAPVLGPDLEAQALYLGSGPTDDRCGPADLERYRIRLRFPPARGSSGRSNVEYVAFETSGPGVEAPREVGRTVDESGAAPALLDLYLEADGVEGEACFRVLSIDITGAASGTTLEACTRLAEGPFFQSLCGASPGRPHPVGWGPGPRGAASMGLLALVLSALGARGRRRRWVRS